MAIQPAADEVNCSCQAAPCQSAPHSANVRASPRIYAKAQPGRSSMETPELQNFALVPGPITSKWSACHPVCSGRSTGPHALEQMSHRFPPLPLAHGSDAALLCAGSQPAQMTLRACTRTPQSPPSPAPSAGHAVTVMSVRCHDTAGWGHSSRDGRPLARLHVAAAVRAATELCSNPGAVVRPT